MEIQVIFRMINTKLYQINYIYLYNLCMLKFLDNRTHQKPAKSPKKYQPEMLYGISAQAPQNFQTPHTIVHKDTYVNPYIPFQQNRQNSLPKNKTKNLHPEWIKKKNLQMVQQQKIVSSEIQNPAHSPASRYMKSYHDEINKTNGRFRITRGQFTDFIEKNNHYKSIGPLHGQQRNQQRIQQTKKSVWLKPDITSTSNFTKTNKLSFSLTKRSKQMNSMKNSMEYSEYFDKMRSSMPDQKLLTNTSSVGQNSKLMSQKARIRDSRDSLNTTFHKDLQLRKKKSPYKFQLPKLQSEVIMTQYSSNKIWAKNIQRQGDNDDVETLKSLDSFQSKLRRKFK